MRYIIIRTVERSTVMIGQSNNKDNAYQIMLKDFKVYFWEKIGRIPGISFDEVYAAYNFGDYDVNNNTAYLNDCHGYNYDWLIIDTYIDLEPSLHGKCYS